MSQLQNLIDLNIAALQEGQRFLSLLNSKQYRQGFKPAFQSDVGTHFRHVLEHYRCFFSQLEKQEFRYDKRERDLRLETEIDYAKTSIEQLIFELSTVGPDIEEGSYTVAEQMEEAQSGSHNLVKVATTIERELLFLQSHTVHHYAMIAAMCRGNGIYPEEGFGVAIPTRNHTQAIDKKQADSDEQETLCAQ